MTWYILLRTVTIFPKNLFLSKPDTPNFMKLLLTPWSDRKALVCALALNRTCADMQVTFLIADWWAVASSDSSAKTRHSRVHPSPCRASCRGWWAGAELTFALQIRTCASSLCEATLLVSLRDLTNFLSYISEEAEHSLNIVIYTGRPCHVFLGREGAAELAQQKATPPPLPWRLWCQKNLW